MGVIRTVTETKMVTEVSGGQVQFDDGTSIRLPVEIAQKFEVGDIAKVKLVVKRDNSD